MRVGEVNVLHKPLCVVGHGRGATSFVAHWLQAQGLDVGHERVRKDGIVESGFSVPTWGVRAGVDQGRTRDEFSFEHTVCVLRNPWKVIATYEAVEHPCAIMGHRDHLPGLLAGLCSEDIDFDKFANDRALRTNVIARSVVRWTSAGIDWATWGFRVEDQLQEFYAFLMMDGFVEDDEMPVPPNTINHRKGSRLSAEEIYEMLTPEVWLELQEYLKETGYA
jgi:hypothetical protein